MPVLIARENLLEASGAALVADSALSGLGVFNLLTPRLGEVWRTGGIAEAVRTTPVSTNSNSGAVMGANTTRTGTTAGFDGTAGRAVLYSNSATTNAYVAKTVAVKGGRRYSVQVNIRRASGASTTGAAIQVQGAGTVRTLNMTALAQGTAWQLLELQFTAEQSGTATIFFAVNTGALDYALDGATLYELVTGTAGSQTTLLAADLGSAKAVNHLVLAAPRDGLLPMDGATVRLCASNLWPYGTEVLDTGMQALAMPRGYWAWLPASAVTARYWWVQFNAPAAQAYLQFGRLWLGNGLLPLKGAAPDGYDPAASDDAASRPRRTAKFQIQALSETEADALEALGLAVGTQQQVLAIPRTERAGLTAVLGRFTTIPSPAPRQAWDSRGRLYTADIALQEDR
ncbi:hypothetical protein RGI145_19595 [Roseomonas gilardii]|uniref:Uncharacterized protein n=1 Tax=Roseomonas gilardii TaxID=257708 RepID=A0A1L7AL90_9PROT|nr:hypothetical protein [Roseomonas gilardii]APT59552.1 hypothetical protein RGI145_19595 [Roseomonas gilardii]